MKAATPATRNLARWLLAHEAGVGKPDEIKVQAAFHACEKLRHHLSKLVGVAGFQSLLSRALTLAKAEAPWLGAVEVKADGTLAWPGGFDTQQDRDETEKGGVILLAQFLGLLVTFIGESLSLRLVRDVWPDAPSTL
jgi:hypothetical protein